MLKYLKLKNVQSHRNTILRFSPGINIIFGISQAGKTAMFRAIRWLLTNRPLGLSLKSDFKNLISVSMKNGSNVVTLTKSDKLAKYVVLKNEKKYVFRKFKGSVPDLVHTALPIDFDLSFQDQLHPYSVFESPTDLGRRIDNVIGTEKLEGWMNKTSKLILSKKNSLKNLKVSIEKDKAKLIRYEGLDDLQEEIKKCFLLKTKISNLEVKMKTLKDFQFNYLKIKRGISDLSGFQKILTIIDGLITDRLELGRLGNKEMILRTYKNTFLEILKLQNQISSLKVEYGNLLVSKKRCPFCFSKISKKHIQVILKNT